jgi:hypothetical protein
MYQAKFRENASTEHGDDNPNEQDDDHRKFLADVFLVKQQNPPGKGDQHFAAFDVDG